MDTTTSTEQQLDEVTAKLRAAVQNQRPPIRPLAHEDFYAWGWGLTEITDLLGTLCRILGPQISTYGDRRILRDDTGGDPDVRLQEMRELLDAVYSALHLTNGAAQAFHNAASHIAVEVDPDTDPDTD